MKQLECPKCKKVHTEKEWDKATQEAYGKEAESIADKSWNHQRESLTLFAPLATVS